MSVEFSRPLKHAAMAAVVSLSAISCAHQEAKPAPAQTTSTAKNVSGEAQQFTEALAHWKQQLPDVNTQNLVAYKLGDTGLSREIIIVSPDNTSPALPDDKLARAASLMTKFAAPSTYKMPIRDPANPNQKPLIEVGVTVNPTTTPKGFIYSAGDLSMMPNAVKRSGTIKGALTFRVTDPDTFVENPAYPPISFITKREPKTVTGLKNLTSAQQSYITEICQQETIVTIDIPALNQAKVTDPGLIEQTETFAQEEDCNSKSRLVGAAIMGETYPDYVASASSKPLEVAQQQGAIIPYAIYDQSIFDAIQQGGTPALVTSIG